MIIYLSFYGAVTRQLVMPVRPKHQGVTVDIPDLETDRGAGGCVGAHTPDQQIVAGSRDYRYAPREVYQGGNQGDSVEGVRLSMCVAIEAARECTRRDIKEALPNRSASAKPAAEPVMVKPPAEKLQAPVLINPLLSGPEPLL
ncbi:MAG TPA: hypothetical protein VFF64_22185 [Candidatus Eremiobacteraceae bacterium]|nr:hypothetical protein [Candidatus Eremiobacteraceae bacterium]